MDMDAGSATNETPTDEYTPTTDDIRETLVEVIAHEETRRLSREQGGALVSLDPEYRVEVENTARAAFDRWLATHETAVREQVARDLEAQVPHEQEELDYARRDWRAGRVSMHASRIGAFEDAARIARGGAA